MPLMKNYRDEFPFEYCASRFLHQWLKKEKPLYKLISSTPDNTNVREALAYFQVSRNFKDLKEVEGKSEFVRQTLLNVRNNSSLSSAEKVSELATTLEKEFHQFNLSAATKLLWLSHRSPFIIYDNRAVNALTKKFNRKFSVRSYEEYSSAWRTEYTAVEADIEAAVKSLPKGRLFMPHCELNDSELLALAKEAWFKERVFDTFLWEVGGEN